MSNVQLLRVASLALAASIACVPAHAIFRAYVASDGNDLNPCTLPAPCRLLPAAVAAVDDGGEIWMLDSANYNTGPVSITKSVSILAIPGALGSVVSTGGSSNSGLVMSTNGVKVSLRNLVFLQVGTGEWGIDNTAAAELTIQDCEFANLGGAISGGAIHANASGGKFMMRDTTVRNSLTGIVIGNGSKATLERVRVLNNANSGIVVGDARASISHSVISGNVTGLLVVGAAGGVKVMLSSSEVSNNATGVNQQNQSGAVASMVASGSSFSHNTTAAILLIQDMAQLDLTLDGNTFAHNGVVVGVTQGAPIVYSRGNNTLRDNSGGDTLTTTALGAQ